MPLKSNLAASGSSLMAVLNHVNSSFRSAGASFARLVPNTGAIISIEHDFLIFSNAATPAALTLALLSDKTAMIGPVNTLTYLSNGLPMATAKEPVMSTASTCKFLLLSFNRCLSTPGNSAPKEGLMRLLAPARMLATLSNPSLRIFQLASPHSATVLPSGPEISTRGKRDSIASALALAPPSSPSSTEPAYTHMSISYYSIHLISKTYCSSGCFCGLWWIQSRHAFKLLLNGCQ